MPGQGAAGGPKRGLRGRCWSIFAPSGHPFSKHRGSRKPSAKKGAHANHAMHLRFFCAVVVAVAVVAVVVAAAVVAVVVDVDVDVVVAVDVV